MLAKTKSAGRKTARYYRKYYRKNYKANFFKIASLYSYCKIDCELFVNNMVSSDNVNQLTAYKFGFERNALGTNQFDTVRFKKLLTNNNEYNAYKVQYQVMKVRGLAMKIYKTYDPLENYNESGTSCLNESLLKFVVNMNSPISGNESTYGTSIELYPHQVFYNKYFKNNVNQWVDSSFPEVDYSTTTNNGELQVICNDGAGQNVNQMLRLCRFKVKLTFYILFKNNKYN